MGLNTYPANPFPPSTDQMDADTLEAEVSKLNSDVSELKSGLTNYHDGFKDAIGWDNHKNLFDKNATNTSNGFVPNAGLGSNNSTSATDDANVSEYIPVTAGVKYTLQGLVGNQAAICFYNSEKTYINGYTYQNQSVKTITAPANSAYARFTVNKANIDITQMEVGSTATSYEPYHPVIGPAVEELQSGLTNVELSFQSHDVSGADIAEILTNLLLWVRDSLEGGRTYILSGVFTNTTSTSSEDYNAVITKKSTHMYGMVSSGNFIYNTNYTAGVYRGLYKFEGTSLI